MRVSEFLHFVYLDEFGHIGPYVERQSQKYNESPVFGVAGIILPENAVRPFATFFLKNKEKNFANELKGSGKRIYKWEKKGTSFIRPSVMKEYPEARRTLHRVMKKVDDFGGHLFYYGREKQKGVHEHLNPTGLYTTCFAHALRRLNNYCEEQNSSFVVVMDQHSARKELLETASKTMFGVNPCRNLASPPFEVESYLNQNIQAADWIATLVGRLTAREVSREEYSDMDHIHQLFSERLYDLRRSSHLEKRPRRDKKKLDGPFAGLADFRKKLSQQQ